MHVVAHEVTDGAFFIGLYHVFCYNACDWLKVEHLLFIFKKVGAKVFDWLKRSEYVMKKEMRHTFIWRLFTGSGNILPYQKYKKELFDRGQHLMDKNASFRSHSNFVSGVVPFEAP